MVQETKSACKTTQETMEGTQNGARNKAGTQIDARNKVDTQNGARNRRNKASKSHAMQMMCKRCCAGVQEDLPWRSEA